MAAKKLDGYVGFANLPNQVHRASVKRGFDFTVMVVGESGLGKSTLVNSLFQTSLYEEQDYIPAAERVEKTVKVQSQMVNIEEKGVRLRLTIVDTPGFGDAVNNDNCWKDVEAYVLKQFENHLNSESRLNRVNKSEDKRVHVCLYFVPPSGHGLRPVDIAFMQSLHHRVNIVPIIAKADTMTKEECKMLKQRIWEDIEANKIHVYKVPMDEEEDEADFAENKAIQDAMPFAVIGSTTTLEVKGEKIRGRAYPWGVVSIENQNHSDFTRLRNFLIRTHYVDLTETTDNLYENYRAERLQSMGIANPLKQAAFHDAKVQKDIMAYETKKEAQMESKLAEKDAFLKEKEHNYQKELEAKDEETKKLHEELEALKRQLSDSKVTDADTKKKGRK